MPRTGASASEAPWPRSAECVRACRSSWAEFATLWKSLLTIGARVVEKAARVRIHFASGLLLQLKARADTRRAEGAAFVLLGDFNRRLALSGHRGRGRSASATGPACQRRQPIPRCSTALRRGKDLRGTRRASTPQKYLSILKATLFCNLLRNNA